jgi:hypothetical protein
MATAWSIGALAAELFSRWLGNQATGLWLYTSLQMFLFLFLLGSVVDYLTVMHAGGTWRRLADLYGLRLWRQRIAFAGPVALAIVALFAEVRGGAGIEAVNQIIGALAAR